MSEPRLEAFDRLASAAGRSRREMQVVVHGQRVEITPELHSQVASQALAALGRFGGRIGPVTVRLHAPCGGADALPICYILVDIHPLGVLGVGDAAPSLEAAADRALERASAVVSDELTRRRRLPGARLPGLLRDFVSDLRGTVASGRKEFAAELGGARGLDVQPSKDDLT